MAMKHKQKQGFKGGCYTWEIWERLSESDGRMPLIGNRIKSKKTGKSGIKNRITSLFTLFQRAYAKTALEKGSLSTGPICYTTADARKPKQRLSGLVPTTQTQS